MFLARSMSSPPSFGPDNLCMAFIQTIYRTDRVRFALVHCLELPLKPEHAYCVIADVHANFHTMHDF